MHRAGGFWLNIRDFTSNFWLKSPPIDSRENDETWMNIDD